MYSFQFLYDNTSTTNQVCNVRFNTIHQWCKWCTVGAQTGFASLYEVKTRGQWAPSLIWSTIAIFLNILMLNTEPLLKQVDFIVISHTEHCSSQEDLKTIFHKLTVIYIFSYVKTGPPPPYPPMWSHPTIEDHNFEKLESTQSENTFTKITAFLADYWYAHHCIPSI